jgi:tRNA(fMet)-specific endonuclease VapC
MEFMLDTDTASFIIKKDDAVVEKARKYAGSWCVSSVVYQELMTGLLSSKGTRLEEDWSDFLRFVDVLSFTQADAMVAAELQVAAKQAGLNIGLADIQIAAHAASAGLTLVANNASHFNRLAGVRNISWVNRAGY